MKLKKNSNKNEWAGLVFSFPLIIGLLVFFIPTVYMGVAFAFSKIDLSGGLKMDFSGFENFHYILRVDADYLQYVLKDLQNLITTLPIIIIFSLFVAVLLNSAVWGRTVFRAIFFLPVIACVGMLAATNSSLVMSTMESAAMNGESTALSSISNVSTMLQSLSFSPQLISIVSGAANDIMNIVNRSGVQILLFLAGIQSISPSIYESANVEGASAWECFWKITLPMLSPTIVSTVLFTFVDSITRDDTVLMRFIKNTAFSKGEFGYAAAMSWFHYLMLVLVLAILGISVVMIGRSYKRGN